MLSELALCRKREHKAALRAVSRPVGPRGTGYRAVKVPDAGREVVRPEPAPPAEAHRVEPVRASVFRRALRRVFGK